MTTAQFRARVMVVGPLLVMCGALVWPAAPSSAADDTPSVGEDAADDAALFGAQCSSCHGSTGAGIEGRGPDVRHEGEAAADFVLRAGRMPLADPKLTTQVGPVRCSDAEIRALVAYVGAFGDGPAIPDVDARRGDLVTGGDLYRLNCAACHVASGAGAIIGGGRRAPSLSDSIATEVGEAVAVGPGAMPAAQGVPEPFHVPVG